MTSAPSSRLVCTAGAVQLPRHHAWTLQGTQTVHQGENSSFFSSALPAGQHSQSEHACLNLVCLDLQLLTVQECGLPHPRV